MLFAAALSVDSNGLATQSNSSHNQPDAHEVFFTPVFSQSVADAAMEAIAAQYQPAWGMLSVSVKYSFWAASIGEVSIGVLLST